MAETAKLLSEGNQDQAIAKMQELSKEADNVDLDAIQDVPTGDVPAGEDTPAPTGDEGKADDVPADTTADIDVQKFTNDELENLKKWASLNVDAPDMATLLSNLKDFIAGQTIQKDAIETLTKKVEKLEEEPISKQAQEDDADEVNKSKKSPFAGMLSQAK